VKHHRTAPPTRSGERRNQAVIVAASRINRVCVAVEIKLSDGTTLRTGGDEILDDLVRAFRERLQAYVPIHTEEGETFHLNPDQIVYIRTVR
jgi:hypothetical protein